MGLPKEIADLVERFERNRESYKAGQYNEMQLRQEFLDPFFGALGWDMNNQQGYAEAYKDVIHEDSIKVGADTKAKVVALELLALDDSSIHKIPDQKIEFP